MRIGVHLESRTRRSRDGFLLILVLASPCDRRFGHNQSFCTFSRHFHADLFDNTQIYFELIVDRARRRRRWAEWWSVIGVDIWSTMTQLLFNIRRFQWIKSTNAISVSQSSSNLMSTAFYLTVTIPFFVMEMSILP